MSSLQSNSEYRHEQPEAGQEGYRDGRLQRKTVDTYGRIDAVVNNAGILRDRMFFKTAMGEWRGVIDMHLNRSYYMSRPATSFVREHSVPW